MRSWDRDQDRRDLNLKLHWSKHPALNGGYSQNSISKIGCLPKWKSAKLLFEYKKKRTKRTSLIRAFFIYTKGRYFIIKSVISRKLNNAMYCHDGQRISYCVQKSLKKFWGGNYGLYMRFCLASLLICHLTKYSFVMHNKTWNTLFSHTYVKGI